MCVPMCVHLVSERSQVLTGLQYPPYDRNRVCQSLHLLKRVKHSDRFILKTGIALLPLDWRGEEGRKGGRKGERKGGGERKGYRGEERKGWRRWGEERREEGERRKEKFSSNSFMFKSVTVSGGLPGSDSTMFMMQAVL